MPFVFVLLGGMLGAMVFGLQGALLGAVLMPLGWMALRQRLNGDAAKPAEGAAAASGVAALAARVHVLEQEVARLRELVDQTSSVPGVAAVDQPDLVSPAIETAPAETRIDASAPSFAAEFAAPSSVVVPPALTAVDEDVEIDLEPIAAATQPQLPPQPPSPPPASSHPSAPPPIPLRHRLPSFVSRFLFGGNTIAKVGVVILFLGLAFLLRYAAERVTVPVQWRYAGVALAYLGTLVAVFHDRGLRIPARGLAGTGTLGRLESSPAGIVDDHLGRRPDGPIGDGDDLERSGRCRSGQPRDQGRPDRER